MCSDKAVCILQLSEEQRRERRARRGRLPTGHSIRAHAYVVKWFIFDSLLCKLTLTEVEFLIVVVMLQGIGWRRKTEATLADWILKKLAFLYGAAK